DVGGVDQQRRAAGAVVGQFLAVDEYGDPARGLAANANSFHSRGRGVDDDDTGNVAQQLGHAFARLALDFFLVDDGYGHWVVLHGNGLARAHNGNGIKNAQPGCGLKIGGLAVLVLPGCRRAGEKSKQDECNRQRTGYVDFYDGLCLFGLVADDTVVRPGHTLFWCTPEGGGGEGISQALKSTEMQQKRGISPGFVVCPKTGPALP